MDSNSNHLLSFFLLYSNHNLIEMATSANSLINTLCSKIDEPVICRECLQADPKSRSANCQGLALIAIAWAERDTTFLHEDTFKILHNATGQLKVILHDCARHSSLAERELQPVVRYVQEGRYDRAIAIIAEDIIPSILYSLKLFDRTPEMPVPQQVMAGTVASTQTCRNAVEILCSI